MRIPDSIFRQSHAARYGGGAFELIVGYDEPGCPRAYHLRYEEHRPEEPDVPRARGTAVHAALALMESEAMPMDEALSRSWPAALGPETYMETLEMLIDWLSRPDDGTHTVANELELTAPLYTDEDFGPIMIGGRIDRLAIVMDQPRLLIFDDYKTDAPPPLKADMAKWIQGYFYAEITRFNAHRWIGSGFSPQIVGRYVALRWYDLEKEYFVPELEMFKAWAESVARRLLRDENPVPILNPGCGRCDYRMDCPAWLELPGQGRTLLERIRNTELESQMALRPEANEVRLNLLHFTQGIDDLARHRLPVGGSLTSGDVEVARVTSEQEQVGDLKAVHEMMGEEFYHRVSMSKKALEQYGRDVPEKRGLIRSHLIKRVTGDSLKWGKKK